MITHQRRKKLLEIIRNQPGLRVPQLAKLLGVSEGTIRNDFNALARDRHIYRVRGGAATFEEQNLSSPAFSIRSSSNLEAKDAIAKQAAQRISDGDSLFLDASTTVFAMARYLLDRRELRVITNGLEVARLLAKNHTNTVIVLGGVLRPDGSSITGSLSEKFLKDLHMGAAYVSSSGFTFRDGLTEVDINETQLKEISIRSAEHVFALIDSTKFGKADLTPFCRLDQITHLFTDRNLSLDWKRMLEQSGLLYTICDE